MIPTVALVGRPNVGKSTLFNKLTNSRDALVADVPGLTRDRRYGRAEVQGHRLTLIDTGGLFGEDVLAESLTRQTHLAVVEADVVVLLLDGRAGITPADEDVVDYLRRENVSFIPVVNKIDGVNEDQALFEVSKFGFVEPLMISASHSRGLQALQEMMVSALEEINAFDDVEDLDDDHGIRVAVVGRPNVGKSTLINRMLGEERQVVFDMPGTTKDAIDIPFTRDDTDYILIDTAGVRRKGKVDEVTEKFSVVKALQAMERAHVVILVVDATEGVVEQDLHVLQYAVEAGAALIVAVNKCDGLDQDQRDRVKKTVDRRLAFIPWVSIQRISALHGTGVGHLFGMIEEVYAAGEFNVSTSILTRLVRNLVNTHPAPTVRGRQIKIKVATRAGSHPPTVVVHGNQLDSLPASYKRYLENGFREALNLVGNPVKLHLREAKNPFADRKNVLTPKQKMRREKMIQHRKKKK